MTVIAALIHDDTIYIGADSASVSGWDYIQSRDSKLFTKGELLIGSSGTAQEGQLIKHALDLQPVPTFWSQNQLDKYMIVTFADAVRELMASKGRNETKDNVQGFDSTLLIGFRGHLYQMFHSYQVACLDMEYTAIGCGGDYAKGSLHSTRKWKNPEDRLMEAMKTAERFSAGVKGPFAIESI